MKTLMTASTTRREILLYMQYSQSGIVYRSARLLVKDGVKTGLTDSL